MKKRHVRLQGEDALVFTYPAKHGKRQVRQVIDPILADVMMRLKRRRGGSDELLAYKEGGRWLDVRSGDINVFIKEATGRDASAKDFRTWNATVLAAVGLAAATSAPKTKTGRRRAITHVVKEVAYYLGNTPAVARASYIDPRVFDRYEEGSVIDVAAVAAGDDATAIQGPPGGGGPEAPRRLGGGLVGRVQRPDRLVARRPDREDLVQPGDLERLGDVRVGVDDRQDAVARAQALDRADEDAERGGVQERRLGQVDDDPGPAGLDRLAEHGLELRGGEQVDLTRHGDDVALLVEVLLESENCGGMVSA
jgi:hypothetical protein